MTLYKIARSVYIKDLMLKGAVLEEQDTLRKALKAFTGIEGTTLVAVKDGKPLGIVKEKTLIEGILAGKSLSTKIKVYITTDFHTINLSENINTARTIMDTKDTRNLVVVDDSGTVVGILYRSDVRKAFNQIFRSYHYVFWSPRLLIALIVFLLVIIIIKDIVLGI